MILYLAGNFPLLNNIKKEREFMDKLLSQGRPYHRLVSFYYPKTCKNVLQLKEEKLKGRKNGRKKAR